MVVADCSSLSELLGGVVVGVMIGVVVPTVIDEEGASTRRKLTKSKASVELNKCSRHKSRTYIGESTRRARERLERQSSNTREHQERIMSGEIAFGIARLVTVFAAPRALVQSCGDRLGQQVWDGCEDTEMVEECETFALSSCPLT